MRVAIPRDLEGMVRTNVGVAREWRMSVRTALEGAFAAGLRITGVDRGAEPDVGHYLLERSR